MMGTQHKRTKRQDRQDLLQFRFLLLLAFTWFFIAAVGNKLAFRHADGCIDGESCFQSAKRNAYSVVPYVFNSI